MIFVFQSQFTWGDGSHGTKFTLGDSSRGAKFTLGDSSYGAKSNESKLISLGASIYFYVRPAETAPNALR